jgi:hypothetical protein
MPAAASQRRRVIAIIVEPPKDGLRPDASQAATVDGAVSTSSRVSQWSAASRELPHISAEGRSPPQNAGRSDWPNTALCMSGSNCAQGCPAGLPCGMPGRGDVMDGAMQQAPQPSRQEKSDWQAMLKVQAQMSSCKTSGKVRERRHSA